MGQNSTSSAAVACWHRGPGRRYSAPPRPTTLTCINARDTPTGWGTWWPKVAEGGLEWSNLGRPPRCHLSGCWPDRRVAAWTGLAASRGVTGTEVVGDAQGLLRHLHASNGRQ